MLNLLWAKGDVLTYNPVKDITRPEDTTHDPARAERRFGSRD
jgi:hypothetical protein